MILDTAGELIADVMTANRSLSGIASASAILDTSNYTFHAITYGKDADGFRNHAHKILSPSSDGIIKVVSYEGYSVSTYHTSATASALEYIYKLNPESPNPLNRRLETKSTLPNYVSGVVDIGHCLNSAIHPELSSYTHLIGCFPKKIGGGADLNYWIVSSEFDVTGSKIVTGILASHYNYYEILDSSGYLTFADGNAQSLYTKYYNSDYSKGVIRAPISDFPNRLNLFWTLGCGDYGGLLLFGGVYHLGLWTLDLKEMLKQGYYPPYSFTPLNNVRKYKLFAKKTLNRDLLYLNDFSSKSGFKEITNPNTSQFGMFLRWDIKFI